MWSLTLKEWPKLQMLEKKVFQKIFKPERHEVGGQFRILHSDKF